MGLTQFKPIEAIALVNSPDNSSTVSGVVEFKQINPEKCFIRAQFVGLSPGSHGFHIHERGNMIDGCASLCAHYNPYNKNHGGPKDSDRHVGDLGNVVANVVGDARLELIDEQIKLYGPTSVIGRSVIVHADPDDLGKGGTPESLRTGSAGARIACGVIGYK